MKFLLYIFFITLYLNSFAQDSRIFENNWFLHSLTVNGNTHVPPVNNEIPFVPADFLEDGTVITGMCEAGGSGKIIFNNTSQFNVEYFVFLAGGCYTNEPFNEQFNVMYMGFWDQQQNPYSYNIEENGSERTLTITSASDKVAIYGNTLLSNEDFTINSFSVYPNPSNGAFFIKKAANISLSRIKIFNVTGTTVFVKENFTPETTINVQNLTRGIYFISFENLQKQTVVKKIIIQ